MTQKPAPDNPKDAPPRVEPRGANPRSQYLQSEAIDFKHY